MPRFRRQELSCLTAFLALSFASKADDNKLDQVLGQLEQVHSFSDVSISPDGHWVAWVGRGSGKSDSVYIVDRSKSGAKPKRIAAGDGLDADGATDIVWSPDSRRLAFLSHGEAVQDQVFVAAPESAKAHSVSNLQGHVSALRWSPQASNLHFSIANMVVVAARSKRYQPRPDSSEPISIISA